MTPLIAPIPDAPLAIIGDVHGEIDALQRLLAHPAVGPERFLVFVGDLVDRGPDSPAVVARVQALVEAGRALCVLGNHELNLLLGRDREGNGWFFDRPEHWQRTGPCGTERLRFESRPLRTAADRERMLGFLRTLPLAATRADLRVVHACWDGPSLAALPAEGDAAALMDQAEAQIHARLDQQGILARAKEQRARWGGLKDRGRKPDEMLEDVAIQDMTEQNGNPVALLTSGKEERIPFARRFYVGGKWRFVERSQWWEHYDEPTAVIVGHYWRSRVPLETGARDVFQTPRPTDWAGPQRSVFCVDFSVGRRYRERAAGKVDGFDGALAAMLWPERELVFSDRAQLLPTR